MRVLFLDNSPVLISHKLRTMTLESGVIEMNNAARKAQAENLAMMGFPLPLAYYALEKSRDDAEAAANWLVTEGIAFTEQHPDVDWLGD